MMLLLLSGTGVEVVPVSLVLKESQSDTVELKQTSQPAAEVCRQMCVWSSIFTMGARNTSARKIWGTPIIPEKQCNSAFSALHFFLLDAILVFRESIKPPVMLK